MLDRSSIVKGRIFTPMYQWLTDRLYRRKIETVDGAGGDMTICVAAVCENRFIVAASDRMITAGDMQYEPNQRKLFHLTPDAAPTSIIGLVSGDLTLQTEVFGDVIERLSGAFATNAGYIPSVKQVARMYSSAYSAAHRDRAARMYLAPLDLDTDTFISRQKEMSDELVNKIAMEMINLDLQKTEAIICGLDNSGAHIYTALNGAVRCEDATGFAAIGAGLWHARTHLMFAGYTRQDAMARALYLVYAGKRRAETSPGVGKKYTDVHFIGPKWIGIHEHLVDKFREIYDSEQLEMQGAQRTAEAKMGALIAAIRATAPTPQTETPKPAKTPKKKKS